MSSGPFVKTKYESDDLNVHPIRVQPEGSPVNGTPPAGNIDVNISAQVGGSRRSYGLHARGIRLYREIGTGATLSRRYNFYPVLTKTAYDGYVKDQTFTIDGVEWKLLNKVPEKSN